MLLKEEGGNISLHFTIIYTLPSLALDLITAGVSDAISATSLRAYLICVCAFFFLNLCLLATFERAL